MLLLNASLVITVCCNCNNSNRCLKDNHYRVKIKTELGCFTDRQTLSSRRLSIHWEIRCVTLLWIFRPVLLAPIVQQLNAWLAVCLSVCLITFFHSSSTSPSGTHSLTLRLISRFHYGAAEQSHCRGMYFLSSIMFRCFQLSSCYLCISYWILQNV
jgi:hypothetical protein